MTILVVMMVVLFSVFDEINKAWLIGENRVETFTQARAALDYMSRELTQAIATNIAFYGDGQHVYFVAPVNSNPQNQADLCEIGYELEVTDPSNPKNLTLKITRRLIAPTPSNCAGGAWNPYAAKWWTVFYNQPINKSTESSTALASNCVYGLQFQYYDQHGNPITSLPYEANILPGSIIVNVTNMDSRTATKLALVPNTAAAWSNVASSTLRVFSTTVYLPNISP